MNSAGNKVIEWTIVFNGSVSLHRISQAPLNYFATMFWNFIISRKLFYVESERTHRITYTYTILYVWVKWYYVSVNLSSSISLDKKTFFLRLETKLFFHSFSLIQQRTTRIIIRARNFVPAKCKLQQKSELHWRCLLWNTSHVVLACGELRL